jgi:hypothetical protein
LENDYNELMKHLIRAKATILPFPAAVLLAGALLGHPLDCGAANLVSCTGGSLGDFNSRGFYVQNYPGITLDSATIQVSGSFAGNYTLALTAHANAYNGPVLGTDTETVALDGNSLDGVNVTFYFPSAPVAKGGIVCFSLTVVGGPASYVYFSIGGGCPNVIETDGTTPPLDSFRRNGVYLTVTGAEGTVTPGWSIQAAIDAANWGETVNVGPGTYTEDIRLKSGVNVVGAGWNATILQGSGTTNVVTATSVSDMRFAGFTVTRSGNANNSNNSGFVLDHSSIIVENNCITTNVFGLSIYYSSPIIRDNIIRGNGCPSRGCGYSGGALYSGYATPLIANNLIVTNYDDAVELAGNTSHAQLVNNTIVGNQGSAIVSYAGDTSVIENNIVTANQLGIWADGAGTAPALSYNDVWNNAGGNYLVTGGAIAAPGTGAISTDPLFDPTSPSGFGLAVASPCIHTGDPSPWYNNPDGTRNTMGAFGGPNAANPAAFSPLATGFIFTTIGNIPSSSISTALPRTGLANVDAPTASALQIPAWLDAPFGGVVQLHGLFGTLDTSVQYYRILAAKWNGLVPPAPGDFQPVLHPLSKIQYTITSGGVTATLVNIGPDAQGLYLRTDLPWSGYWSSPDLKLMLNTQVLDNGRYDFILQAFTFDSLASMVTLPANTYSRITLYVDNNPPVVNIVGVRDHNGNAITECSIIQLANNQENLLFDFQAYQPEGFLDYYSLGSLYGRNHTGGSVTSDHYAGVHAAGGPSWVGAGPGTQTVGSQAAQLGGTLSNWQTCAYQFHLEARARTTDGVNPLYWTYFDDHYYISVGPLGTTCVGDLNGDGRVDGLDLSIFASRFGITCP